MTAGMASSETTAASAAGRPLIVLIPFPTMGHTIPLVDLAHLLLIRGAAITIFSMPENSSFVRSSLGNTEATIFELVELPNEEEDALESPTMVQSTESSQSMSSFVSFISATKRFQKQFEQALQTLKSVGCIISDAFLKWTLQSASKFNIPRLAFYGMTNYTLSINLNVQKFGLNRRVGSEDDDEAIFQLHGFPSVLLFRRELGMLLKVIEDDWMYDFIKKINDCTLASHGLLVNSFHAIETTFADYWDNEIGPKAWYVGPLCINHHRAQPPNQPKFLQWLDERLAMGRPVLYVAFGTQAEVPWEQLKEIAVGLERSGVDFFWVLRSKEANLGDRFEERVAERGLVVREWVEQLGILRHESVKGFMSHCGWNSVLESICAKVPILAWPMMAEQHLNAKMVEEKMGIGLRIPGETGECSRLVVGSETVEKMVRELMVEERGKAARDKAKQVGEEAEKAVEEGGSSFRTLESLIDEFGRKK